MAEAGRPSKYKPAYCDEVIAAGDEGLSLLAFAGIIGVGRTSITRWKDEHPEFAAACEVHQAKRSLALEKDLLKAESGPSVTSRIFALKNAAPEEWKDKQDFEHSGGVTVQIVRFGE
jgi:transposase